MRRPATKCSESRWLKPFGQRIRHSELWRFTRRSVPRGVAVGLFVGIFLMVPGVQIVGAALLSAPFRANIPIAAAMTFLSNPGDHAVLHPCRARDRQPDGLPCRSRRLPGARLDPCQRRPLARLAVLRCRAVDGLGPAGDLDRGRACRIYRVAGRMALVDGAQMASNARTAMSKPASTVKQRQE